MNPVRRMDNLGRIVIPKELRDKGGDKCGDSFEIIPFGVGYILKRHSPREHYTLRLRQLRKDIYSSYDNPPAELIEYINKAITLLETQNKDGI